jgi:Transcription factor zinc-finger
MDDQKDRFGDKIRDLEKVREDQWAREQDRALLEKMRARQHSALHCPECEAELVAQGGGELTVMACPNGHGAWLDGAALKRLANTKK